MDLTYIALAIASMIVGVGAQAYVHHKLNKYSEVPLATNITGAEAARQMLASFGIDNVEILPGKEGEDFFDPKTNSIKLGPDSFDKSTITSIATACHEAGHACQFANGYAPMKARGALFPVANLCSQMWIFLFAFGIILNMVGLIWAAIALYAALLLFALVTLPVEFNASRRAMAYMESIGLPQSEQRGAFDALRACALTYVAAALASAVQLIYMLGKTKR